MLEKFQNDRLSSHSISQIVGGKYTYTQSHTATCDGNSASYSRQVTVWSCGHVDYGPWEVIQ